MFGRRARSIPPELGNLSTLWVLHLDNNDVAGPIPSEPADLEALTPLYLGGNPNLCTPDEFPALGVAGLDRRAVFRVTAASAL